MIGQFNQNSGIEDERALHLSDQLNERLMTAEGVDNFWRNLNEDADFQKYGAMRISERAMESTNEDLARDILERASVSGGKLGVANQELSQHIDRKFQRFDGSVTSNISAQERVEWKEEEHLALDVPEVSYVLDEGPEMAVQALAVALEEAGIDIEDAMKASSSFDVLQNLADLAKENGMDDIAEYNNTVQVAFAGMGIPEAIQNVAPEITELENVPQLAMSDLEYDQRQQPVFGMSA